MPKKVKTRRVMALSRMFFGLDEFDEPVCTVTDIAGYNREQRRLGNPLLAVPDSRWALIVAVDRPDGTHYPEVHEHFQSMDEAFDAASVEFGVTRFVSEADFVRTR